MMVVSFFFLTFAPSFEQNLKPMRKTSLLYRAYDLYYDGFRHMTVGRTLWAVILVKLVIIFLVLKLFFFPSFIGQHSEEGQEAAFVAGELMERAN